MRYFLLLAAVVSTWTAAAVDKVYFGNLHSHTSYSDGSGTPAEAYRYARDTADLDFLAITEHNHSKAEQGIKQGDGRKDGILISKTHSLYNGTNQASLISAARRYTEDNRFVAIYGQEFSTISSGNHVNVFEIGSVIDETAVPNGNYKELLDWLEANPDSQQLPAIIQFNHPSSEYRAKSTEYGSDDFTSAAEWQARMSRYACTIEVLNGPGTINKLGLKPEVTQADYLHYLNLGFKLGPTGDQDNHWKNWGLSTEARTGVIADALTKPKILEAIRKRRVYATEDRNLRLIFYVNTRLCGDVIPTLPAVGSELNIKYSIVDDDEPDADYTIEVYADQPGGQVASVTETVQVHGNNPPTALRSIEDVTFRGDRHYLFFKVTQHTGEESTDQAWTAPVWFETQGAAPAAPSANAEDAVASKNSAIYHVPSCRVAKGIKDANKVFGVQATTGRSKHTGCPLP